MKLAVGDKVKVRYVDDRRTCTLDVEVTAIASKDEFSGRVEAIFSDGQLTGGHTYDELMGRERTFKVEDVLARDRG